MSRYQYDGLASSPRRPTFHTEGGVHLPRTSSLIEVRALMKEHESNPEFQKVRKSEEELKGIKNKQLREYYTRQNLLVRILQTLPCSRFHCSRAS